LCGVHLLRSRLPLVTLYVTERCNSRCVTCDHWRHGRADASLASIAGLLPSFELLGTRMVALSGGEPLLHAEWAQIAQLLKSRGLELWLLTSGLSLAKHARRACALFDAITVSLDGTNRETYAAIRGLDAFDKVLEGIRAAASYGVAPSIRVTLQRSNYRQLPEFVDLARAAGARQVSFLAVDVANPHAFGRLDDFSSDLALRVEDLAVFEDIVRSMQVTHAESFASGFIAESPLKLGRILQYFSAVCGRAPFPPVRCNAPEFSAVIDANGRVQPCYFIPGPPDADAWRDFRGALDGEGMAARRAEIRAGKRPECITCVCSMWRELDGVTRSVARAPGVSV
jgi:MoaA/NifB/PqqE/SkfB family radical SAM enzyme